MGRWAMAVVFVAMAGAQEPRYVGASWGQVQGALPAEVRLSDWRAPDEKAELARVAGARAVVLKGFPRYVIGPGGRLRCTAFPEPSVETSWPVGKPGPLDAARFGRLLERVRWFPPTARFRGRLELVDAWFSRLSAVTRDVRKTLARYSLTRAQLRELLDAMPVAPGYDSNLSDALKLHLYQRVGQLMDPAVVTGKEGRLEVLPTADLMGRITRERVEACWLPSSCTFPRQAWFRDAPPQLHNPLGLRLAMAMRDSDETFPPGEPMLQHSVHVRMKWNYTRAVIAMYLFRAEHRRFPASFQEMVREGLLKEAPVGFLGSALPYRPEWVRSWERPGQWELFMRWYVDKRFWEQAERSPGRVSALGDPFRDVRLAG